MEFMNKRSAAFAAFASLVGAAHAVTVDGTAEAAYGPALFTQTIGTGFGDNNGDSVAVAQNGSELDTVYGTQDATNLNLVVGGNLESNFNKLVLFFDTGVGGFNTLPGDNASTADSNFVNGLGNRGIKFDSDFNASYVLWVRNGGKDASNTMYVSLAKLGSATVGGADVFDISGTGTSTATVRTATFDGFASALNNINVAGVNGSSGGASSGAGVTTGFELSVLRSLLGATGAVRVAGFIDSPDTYLSNQVIGGLPVGTDNLATTATDFSTIEGNQYVTLAAPVPEPSAFAALGLGALALVRRRRK